MAKKKQFLVVGLGRFGSAIATTLMDNGMEVMGIDSDMTKVEDHRGCLTNVLCGDAMDKVVLEQIDAQKFDVALVTIGGDLKAGCVVTMLLKEMGVKHIIAKAGDEFHGRMLEKLGADEVLLPERDMGQRIAHHLISDGIMDYIALSQDYSLVEIMPHKEWIGKSLIQLNLRAAHNMNVIAIRNGETVNAAPKAETVIEPDDIMLVLEHHKRG